MPAGYGGMLGSLGLVLGLLAVALFLLKRDRRSRGPVDEEVPLRLVKRIAVGPRQGIGLLQAGDRLLVVSLADSGVRLIAPIEDARAFSESLAPVEDHAVSDEGALSGGRDSAVVEDSAPRMSVEGLIRERLESLAGPSGSAPLPSRASLRRLRRRAAWTTACLGLPLLLAALPLDDARAQRLERRNSLLPLPGILTGAPSADEPAGAPAMAAARRPGTTMPLRSAWGDSTAVLFTMGEGMTTLFPRHWPSPAEAESDRQAAEVVPVAAGRSDRTDRSRALPPPPAFPALPAVGPRLDLQVGDGADGLHLSGAVGIVVFLGALTLLPALLLLMTSFTRILIVLQFLRPAIGTQNAPPTQVLVALAVLLTSVVMNPVLQKVNQQALQPYMRGEVSEAEAFKIGLVPFRQFMLRNVNEKDLATFVDLTAGDQAVAAPEDVPTMTLASAFVTSELRTSFQMGFLIFVPFVVIDLIVASVLMSLGMFMLPPHMVSLPFKLLLFVLADGWVLVVKNLVLSFR